MIINEEAAKGFIVQRATDTHKGECGRILVVAGSTGLTGAAALASMAAMRAGAGIVSLACAQSLNHIFEIKLTEVMTIPVAESEPGHIGKNSLPVLVERAKNFDVTLLGPGLGRGAGAALSWGTNGGCWVGRPHQGSSAWDGAAARALEMHTPALCC